MLNQLQNVVNKIFPICIDVMSQTTYEVGCRLQTLFSEITWCVTNDSHYTSVTICNVLVCNNYRTITIWSVDGEASGMGRWRHGDGL